MKQKLCVITLLLLSVFCSPAQTNPGGLKVNEHAPDFSAADQHGKTITLRETLKKGPLVLVFYRGQWCPHCNKHLKLLEDSLSYITAKGATVIAVTPELPGNISKTVEKTRASYSILYDDSMKIMRSYEVAFAVDVKTIEKYKQYGIDFANANGNNGANLPVPALYIIDKNGKISYRYFNTNYTKRASVAEVLEHL